MSEDPLRSWLGAVGDRSVAIAADPSPYWVDLVQQLALHVVRRDAIEQMEAGRFGRDALSIGYSATRLGFAARRAECEALGLHEGNPDLAGLLEERLAGRAADDMLDPIADTVVALMAAADRDASDPLLAPAGMGRDSRRRLGAMTIEAMLDRPGGHPALGTLGEETLLECWRFGYYLAACAASLPPAAAGALSELSP